MQLEVLRDAETVAARAEAIIAENARAACEARGLFLMAVSGGHTPWVMLSMLANKKSLGLRFAYFRWTSGSRQQVILTATSLI